jgi:hypothetical protein
LHTPVASDMFFSSAALALFAAGASAKMIDITVGGANLTFSPEAIVCSFLSYLHDNVS